MRYCRDATPVLGLPTEVVPCFLVRDDIFENGDVAMRPRLIYVHMLVFAHGLQLHVDRWATSASRIPAATAVDSECTLSTGFSLDTGTRLPSPFLVVRSNRILPPLGLETYRTFPVDRPWGTYPTPPLFRHTPLHDLEACGVTPARAVVASD
jgi:hypothetical protein